MLKVVEINPPHETKIHDKIPLYLKYPDMPELQIIDPPTAEHFREKYLEDIINAKKINEIEGFENYIPYKWEKLKQYFPKKEYFEKENHADGIHGIAHAIRVELNVLPLAFSEGLNEEETKLVLAAASLHDRSRIYDTVDEGHGARAAKWINDNRNFLINEGYNFSEEEFETIETLVTYHEVNYSKIPEDVKNRYDQYGKNKIPLLSVLMDADKLERFRSPNEEWWPKPEYFQLKSTSKLYESQTAKALCLYSQYFQFSPQYMIRRIFRHEEPIISSIHRKAKDLGYINFHGGST